VYKICFSTSNLSQNSNCLQPWQISVADKQFHITPMGPMIGVMVSQEVLMAHQCHTMTHFELG
jgi:hypothetical protein